MAEGIPWQDILIAGVSLSTGIIATYFGAVIKFRKDFEFEYDKDLRQKRIQEYLNLWKLLQPLAFYSPPGPVTYCTIIELSREMRQWYYEKGGIYLSSLSRDSYFALQKKIQEDLTNPHNQNDLLPDQIREEIKKLASSLRTSMSNDVGTRMKSRIDTREH